MDALIAGDMRRRSHLPKVLRAKAPHPVSILRTRRQTRNNVGRSNGALECPCTTQSWLANPPQSPMVGSRPRPASRSPVGCTKESEFAWLYLLTTNATVSATWWIQFLRV